MIFLHSSFRTSSTWLFSRFRCFNSLITYNEIFSDDHYKISKTDAETLGPGSWYSKHSASAPYFLEYVPLIKEEGGVVGFDASMAFDRFIPSAGIDGPLSKLEIDYIGGLVRHSELLGKEPLLCCTRSLGRTFALKRAFPGIHILICRNIFQQWCSYCEQSIVSTNYYFLWTIPRIVESNTHDRFFNFLHNEYKNVALDSSGAFDRFVLFHLYLYGRCYDGYDIILDISLANRSQQYQSEMEMLIHRQCGIPIKLSNIKESIGFTFTPHGSPAEFSTRMNILKEIVTKEISSTETDARRFIEKCVTETVEVFDRYYFYTRSLSEFASKLIENGKKPT